MERICNTLYMGGTKKKEQPEHQQDSFKRKWESSGLVSGQHKLQG